MIDKSAYLLRISQANPVGLVVINFELILDFLTEAVVALEPQASAGEAQDALPPPDFEVFRTNVQKAKSGLEQLIQSLDFEVPIAHDFYEIYNYVYKLLCNVQFSSDGKAACVALKEVSELMEILLEGWRDTAEKADNLPPASEGPKVYTGLTYGRDGQANEYIDENKDRGYMA